jgi:tRNA 2-thiouridine synthesizing protein E
MLKVNEKLIEVDSEGYLINPEEWNKEVAIELAKSEDIELSDDYWAIFDFMQSYYKEHGIVPDIRHTAKNFGEHLGVDKKSAKTKLFLMFPYGYVKQTCKISGMKRPRGWSTG